ncbi:Wzb Protein-tyrosine-phosphatase [Mycobacteriaceae bacterium]
MHIFFICTGNICRSPTAERLAAAYAALHEIPDLTASSAGTRAVIGHPIHRDAAHVLEQMGAHTSDFAARQLTQKIALKADLIIAMTREHRDIVLETAPRQLPRTFTLMETARLTSEFGARTISDLAALRPRLAANELLDIPDPIGQSPEVFAAVGAQIASLLPPIMELCRRTITA